MEVFLTDDTAKANAFNTFFSEAGKLTHGQILILGDDSPMCDTLESITVSEEEVLDQIRILNGNKSYGPDGISPKLIKIADNFLVKPMTRLYNLSLSLGKVPNLWNQANVIPLHNKNSEELYCVTSFGLKTEVDEIQRDKNYAEHKLVG